MNKVVVIFALLGLGISCKTSKQEAALPIPPPLPKIEYFDYTQFDLEVGDILFQDSDCGPFCTSIEKVTSGIAGANFSHVGMVIPTEKRGLMVLEAISKGVVLTPLDTFFVRSFDANNQSKVVVGRMKEVHKALIPRAVDFAKTKIGLAYDDVFNIYNDRYYCSELIYDAFKFANGNQAIFQLEPMTYIDPDTEETFPIWADYFQKLQVPIPEGEPGLNPGGMSMSPYIDIVHFYGKPSGYKGEMTSLSK